MNKIAILFLLMIPAQLLAQSPNYAAAERFDVPNLQKQVGRLQIIPFFLKKSNKFWFATDKKTEGSKNEFSLVDANLKRKQPLFDKQVIIASLTQLNKVAPNPKDIAYDANFSEDERTVEVTYNKEKYSYDYTHKELVKQPKSINSSTPRNLIGNRSPDQKWILYADKHDLYLKGVVGDTTEFRLSDDGSAYHSFSMNETDAFANAPTATDAVWSSDSKAFYVLRKDNRKVGTMTVTNSIFEKRPYVTTYKYELPEDKDVGQYEFFIGDVTTHTLKKVSLDRWPDQQVEVLQKQDIGKEVFLLRKKRTRDEIELCAVNFATAELRVIINEVSRPFINTDLFSVSILNKGKDILWWSDRSGWGHYYLYNNQGRLTNTITNGDWTAGKIASIDTINRFIYFYGYGKNPAFNPNYSFLYKKSIDDNNQPKLLTPEDANHSVFVAPSKKYFVDNFSRTDLTPRTVVRDNNGKFIIQAYQPNLKQLYAYGWKQPERFSVKAKDGITELYGLMWKPFNFDPAKKYPIISQVYPGPFTETVWNDFTVFDRYNNTSLAQIGFIVVVMGHRGGSPYRNAAYYKYGFGKLRDYALEDDKNGLEQLAGRFSFIDLNRLGIFGHSGGGAMATTAICTYPDFYKAAVSSSGDHDNRIYNRTWGETYNGLGSKMEINQTLAKNLKGHLLLVTGESDQNVNPANTFRMADALIKAGKDFDLLVLPGQSHTYEEPYKTYFQKKLRSYFATYLME
ncbi:DPP IV N-terminal domain-containing protein [Pedobacter sp. P26]|uniref:S9 family peptidase n=1 Tax=Pedobacter sp. P26 TaxID=3423956 RepID=UPI003D666440